MSHLEFVVLGPPVSHQTHDKPNLKAWQAKVKAEAAKSWTGSPLKGKLKFTLYNFHEGISRLSMTITWSRPSGTP